jgi:hypothetical protein
MKKLFTQSIRTLFIICSLLLVSKINFAQVANNYIFSQSNGTYNDLGSSGTQLAICTGSSYILSFRSQNWTLVDGSFPFSFVFDGVPYTGCNINSNGYITFGSTLPDVSLTNPISSSTSYQGAISAWGRDLNGIFDIGGRTGEVRWAVDGVLPNRQIVIQFKNWRPSNSISSTIVPFINFQIRLHETTNKIEIVYGETGFANGSNNTSQTAEIGLRGVDNTFATNVNNRFNDVTSLFTSSIGGTANSSTQAFSTANATPGMPSNGLTYTWAIATCFPTSTPNVSNITDSEATFTWIAPNDLPALGYDWEIRTSGLPGSPNPTSFGNTSDTILNVSGLSVSTPYVFYVRSNCAVDDSSSWKSVSFQTVLVNDDCSGAITLASCSSGIQTISGTTNSSTLDNIYVNCGAGGTSTTERGVWYVYNGVDNEITINTCSSIGFDTRLTVYEGTCGALDCITGNNDMGASCSFNGNRSEVKFNALAGTTYYIYVHGFQTGSDLSATGNFELSWSCSQLCVPVPVNNICASASLISVQNSPDSVTNGFNSCASVALQNPSCVSQITSFNDVWYEFEATNTYHELRLNFSAPVSLGYALYTGSCGSASLSCVVNGNVVSGQDYLLNNLTIGETYRIQIYSTEATVGDFEIVVWENSCPAPISLNAIVTSDVSANLSWTALGSVSSWNLYHGISPLTAPDENTIPTLGSINSNNPYQLTGLSGNTNYEYYVQSECGIDGVSSWVGPFGFTTLCEAATAPFLESFESGYTNNLPIAGCWIQESITGLDVWNANTNTTFNRTPRTGSFNATLGFSNEDWLFYPVNLVETENYFFEVYARQDGAVSANANVGLYYGNLPTASAMNVVKSPQGIVNEDYQKIFGTFSPDSSGVYYLGVKGFMNGVPRFISIDDISLTAVPNCLSVEDVTFEATTTSALLSWTALNSETSWIIEYGNSGFSQGSGDSLVVNNNPYTLTNLTPNTAYDFYILADCGAGNESDWLGPFTFTTLCTSTALPYSEDFETTNISNIPSCASIENAGNGNNWTTTNNPGNGFTSNTLTYNTNINNPANAWFFTPGLELIGGTNYRLTFSYGNDNVSNIEYMAVSLGATAESSAMTELLEDFSPFNQAAKQNATIDFVPDSTGVFYIGFNAYSDPNQGNIYIDDILVEELVSSVFYSKANGDLSLPSNWNTEIDGSGTDAVDFTSESQTFIYNRNNSSLNSPLEISGLYSKLVLENGSELELEPAGRLTLNVELENNGTLTLKSGATILTNNGMSGNGTYNVEQFLKGSGGATPNGRFYYMGTPVTGATTGVFDAANNNRFWTHTEVTGLYTRIMDNATALEAGGGYTIRMGADETVVYSSNTLNNGNFTFAGISNTQARPKPERGINLWSNPYPSHIDWELVNKTNIDQTYQLRTENTSNNTMVFDTYNAISGIGTNNNGNGALTKYIAPFQAVWVRVNANLAPGTLALTNSLRSHQNGSELKSNADQEIIRLHLSNGSVYDETVIYMHENANNDLDAYDSQKMMDEYHQLFSVEAGSKLVLNGIENANAKESIQLGIKIEYSGNYSIVVNELNTMENVVLEDKKENKLQDLKVNPRYVFTTTQGEDLNRFVLHFNKTADQTTSSQFAASSKEEVRIFAFNGNQVKVIIDDKAYENANINVYNMLGGLVSSQRAERRENILSLDVASGIYMVELVSKEKVTTQKVIIK